MFDKTIMCVEEIKPTRIYAVTSAKEYPQE